MRNAIAFVAILTLAWGMPGRAAAQGGKNAPGKNGYLVEEFTHEGLSGWKAYGTGGIEADHGQTAMYEDPGSKGFMLVSPLSYRGNTIVSYEVMPLNAATVLIIELAAHAGEGYGLELDPGYDGNVQFLFKNVNMYMFAFHNAAHNKDGAFVRKYPQPGTPPLAEARKNTMEVGKYHRVEAGLEDGRLWLRVDGKKAFRASDPSPYQGGKVILRVRGTANVEAACLIRNLKIYSKTPVP